MLRRSVAFGPGLAFLLGTIGPRDLITNSIAGASSGYSLLWLIALGPLVRFFYLEASARYVLVTGRSLLTGCGNVGRWIVLLWFVMAVLNRHVYALIQITLLGTGAHFVLPLPTRHSVMIWGLSSWVAGFALMYWGRYRGLERISKPLGLLLGACIVMAAVLSRPDLSDLVKGAFSPSLPADVGVYSPTLVLMALLAGAVGSNANLQYSAFVHEKGWRNPFFLRRQRIDLLLSMAGSFLMLAMIQVAAAGALRPRGIQVAEMEDLIPVFSGVLGHAGRIFLGLTIWSMVFSNYVGYGTGYGLMIAEVYHRFVRPSGAIAEQDRGAGASYLPAFRWITAYVLLCPLYVFFTGWSPVRLVLVGGAASALSLPIVTLVILRLTADPKIMGEHANSWLTNIVLVLAGVGALYLGYQGIVRLWPAVRGS